MMQDPRTPARWAATLLVAQAMALAGCGQTEECTELAKLVAEHEKALGNAKVRAGARKNLQGRADKVEAAMTKLVAESGIELSEDAINTELLARVAKIPTATVTHSLANVGSTQDGDTITTTEWQVTFSERDLAKTWDDVVVLATVPPLLTLTTVSRTKIGSEWRVTLQKPAPVRLPMQPDKVPLLIPPDPDTIAQQTGFCGAKDMRAKIVAMRQQIADLREDAETAAMLLAAAPTFEGIRRRTEMAVRNERDARQIMTKTMEGAAKEKLPVKAIGYEDPSVIVELWGGPKELKALETLLLPFGDRVKPTEMNAPGVVRRAVMVRQSSRSAGDEH